MEMPPIRYTRASDGTRIAYTIVPGASPPWLHIYTQGAPTIEQDLSIAARRGYIENLARGRKTVLYDSRGSGLSGPIPGEVTFDDLIDEVAVVTAAVGEPLDVSALGMGCLVAIAYASGGAAGWRSLLLHSAVARWAGSYADNGHALWRASSYLEFLRNATRYSMDVSAEETERVAGRWAELVPEATMVAYRSAVLDIDVLEAARKVRTPTLITTGGPRIEKSTELAEAIPGAVLVTLSSLVHRPELGTEVRELWETHVRPQLGMSELHEATVDGSDLSARERDILRLVATGQTNAGIGSELVLSTRTIERHVQNIYNKLGVHNRIQAANWAREHGVI
jgi:DNA-binding NarL/FixJ family response regulator